MQLDEVEPLPSETDLVDPHNEADEREGEHHDEPEPEEQVDLLVEEVDRQHALHGVAVDVAPELTHLEVADGDAREHTGSGPVLVARQMREQVDAVPVVVGREEDVHEEQLPDDVDQVHDLDEQVEHGQVVAELLARHEVQAPVHGRPEAGENPALRVAVVTQVAIDVAADVLDGLVPLVRIAELSRRLDQVVQVDARRDVVAPPEHGRSVEEQRLHDEHHVHPLVVGYLALIRRLVGVGEVLVER